MTLDDLKTQWRTEMEHAQHAHDLDFDVIRSAVARFHRGVRFGTFWMIFSLVCGSALSIVFGWLTIDDVAWRSKLNIAANVAVTVWIIIVLLRARRVVRLDDWTLRSRLETEIERLEKQRNLWYYVPVWLLAPMTVSVLLALPVRLYWIWFALCALIFWLGRRERQKTTDPLLVRLKGLHRELIQS